MTCPSPVFELRSEASVRSPAYRTGEVSRAKRTPILNSNVDASANAAIAKSGTNVDANFVNGVAPYQFTDKGLMLQADISGTKYRKNKKLNNN